MDTRDIDIEREIVEIYDPIWFGLYRWRDFMARPALRCEAPDAAQIVPGTAGVTVMRRPQREGASPAFIVLLTRIEQARALCEAPDSVLQLLFNEVHGKAPGAEIDLLGAVMRACGASLEAEGQTLQ